MNIIFPSQHDKDPKRASIGRWIQHKRRQYDQGKLSKHWIDKFEQTFPGWKWKDDRSKQKKDKLLEMARKGEPRPIQKTKAGQALCSYISGSAYDPEFDKQIRKLATHWFIDTSDENKKKLLEMARNGEPRPNSKTTRLGRSLKDYIGKSSRCYDTKFDKEIRKLAPHWFVNTAKENKKRLLEMARNSENRPSQKTKSGVALNHYSNKSSDCYDPKFDKKIRKLAPQWFVKTANENRQKLLEMARKGESRPTSKTTKLGRALSNYIRYHPEFTKEIKSLAPHWFKAARVAA